MIFSGLRRAVALALAASLALVVFASPASISAEQYRNIKPGLRCHFPRKQRSFCRTFPNFSLRQGICNPEPELLGHIEWCREDVTITDRKECGEYETYEAVVVTYRKVYENGAWGEKFKRTYRKQAFQIAVPPLAKGVLK